MGRDRAVFIFLREQFTNLKYGYMFFLGKSWPICNRDHHAVIDMQAQSPFGEQFNSHHPSTLRFFFSSHRAKQKNIEIQDAFFPLPPSPWVMKISCYNLLPGLAFGHPKIMRKERVFLRLHSPQKYGFYKHWRLWGFPWCLYSLR